MNDVKVMGIVNVTPDSFSDGGMYYRTSEAVRRAENMIEEGADIVDLGGESTRPGAVALDWSEEWSRISGVLAALASSPVPVSVDTYHPETARRALDAGAKIVNCVKRETVPAMLPLLEEYKDVSLVADAAFWGLSPFQEEREARLGELEAFGGRVWLDPMIGFSTTREEDLALIRHVPRLAAHGPVLVGASRKRIVKKLTGEKVTGKNLGGNLAIAAWCAMNGASAIRVHDVAETVQLFKTYNVLAT